MLTKSNKRRSLLGHWTFLYVATLCAGLLLIGVISVFWIRWNAIHNRLQNMQLMAQELATKMLDENGKLIKTSQLPAWIDRTQLSLEISEPLYISVTGVDGKLLYTKNGPRVGPDNNPYGPPKPPSGSPPSTPPGSNSSPPSGSNSAPPQLQSESDEDLVLNHKDRNYVISVPILLNGADFGTLTLQKPKESLVSIGKEYLNLTSLLAGLGLLGWLVIYLLARKLTRPIIEVAQAAKRIESGDFQIQLREDVREQEIYELLDSFRKMAGRLDQLEQLRNDLLAGVSHDLKTPITSIQGLIHAVRDQIVIGKEAEEFLDISLKESERLKQMVSDLLDFNSFASGKINVDHESIDLRKLINEIIYQWSLIGQEEQVVLDVLLPDGPLLAVGDPSRIQQIMVNLLNNSRQALNKGGGRIQVSLSEHSKEQVSIHVADTGCGIPEDEQPNIFERYFRGTHKKLHVRGLGLGLTFSRMLATAMGGSLTLEQSSPQGTTFQLLLPRR